MQNLFLVPRLLPVGSSKIPKSTDESSILLEERHANDYETKQAIDNG